MFFLLLQINLQTLRLMKKNILLIFLYIFILNSHSQISNSPKYLLTSNTDLLGLSVLNTLDPYLSPLNYSGLGLRYSHAERKYFSPENTKLSMIGKFSALAGLGLNPENTASMMIVCGNYSWGAQHHFRLNDKLEILAGGNVDVNMGVKSIARNVNNPVNVDLATNINLSSLLRYDFTVFKLKVRLKYQLEIPVIGAMFVPTFGQSYYEMFEIGNLSNAIHFSAFHNKRGVNQDIQLEIPFNKSTIQIGFGGNSLKYKANEMVFYQNEFNLQIAYIYDIYKISGSKKALPENFISTQK